MPIDLSFWNNLTVKDWIIVGLDIGLLAAFIYILFLHRRIKLEKRKRVVPFLIPELSVDGGGVFLRNQDSCLAKDIEIEDIAVNMDLDFEKVLTLKFNPIPSLSPNRRMRLSFTTYDGEFKMPSVVPATIIGHLGSTSFDMRLHYSNLDNTRFFAHAVLTKGRPSVKLIEPENSNTQKKK